MSDTITVKFKKLHPDAVTPTRSYDAAAGWDLYALDTVTLGASTPTIVEVGIAVEIPEGYFGWIVGRSSTAKNGMVVPPGIIDSDYRGEIGPRVVWTPSHSIQEGYDWRHCVLKGERIAQLLILPHVPSVMEEVVVLSETTRGDKGHGSTGK